MSWNINIPVKDGKVVTEEITVSGTLPGEQMIRVFGHEGDEVSAPSLGVNTQDAGTSTYFKAAVRV